MVPYYQTLHFIFLNLHRTLTGKAWAEPDDPQRGPLPLLSLQIPHSRLLQTLYRQALQIFRMFLRCPFPLFHGMSVAITPHPPAPAYQAGRDGGNTYDLECVEIWERFARSNQFQYRGTRLSN